MYLLLGANVLKNSIDIVINVTHLKIISMYRFLPTLLKIYTLIGLVNVQIGHTH